MPPEQEASQLHVRPFLVVSTNCAGAANATLMRSRQSRAPINQYHHDQHNNDHHNSRRSEPPNSDAISPTARRSVAPTTWRNVARVAHLIPFIEPNRDITFYVRSGFGNTIASHEVYPEVIAFCQSDPSYAACSCRRGHRVKRPRCPVVALLRHV